MGVTGLWTVVQPCARPIKIETLNKKRLAVDASIWIYQFLKAVRDKEGNALRNSHVVGFFRRICKLLFIGINPVFVFDGGAPVLKRQTISSRKQRREGRRDDAIRTAGKLLALQMQRRAEEEEQKRKEELEGTAHREEQEPLPDNLAYVDELQMTPQERQQNRKFRKKDQYHLPDLDVSIAEMGGPNDPRVMSLEELEQYAQQFNSGEDINVYDFSKIDFDSPFFMSLPDSDRYNILNAARLRSRLRMGLSKDQLDGMFPNRMDFSRFQIDRVRERNELTQRLMNLNGSGNDPVFGDGTGRVAGEKGREYVLVKNAGVEGGWALGVIGDKDEGQRSKPIDVEAMGKHIKDDEVEDGEDDENDGFEDVPIEGLNRLPKRTINGLSNPSGNDEHAPYQERRKRRTLYAPRTTISKTSAVHTGKTVVEDPDALFITETTPAVVPDHEAPELEDHEDEDELRRAIAMSLERGARGSISADEDYEEVFHQSRLKDLHPSTSNLNVSDSGLQKPENVQAGLLAMSAEASDEDDMDFEDILAVSKQSKHQLEMHNETYNKDPSTSTPSINTSARMQQLSHHKFDGPLPFEKLDLGDSILGKKKMKQIDEATAGGFEKTLGKDKKDQQVAELPPWFSGDAVKDMEAQRVMEARDRQESRRTKEEEMFDFSIQPKLRTQVTTEIIDVDEVDKEKRSVTLIESSDDEVADDKTLSVMPIDLQLRMGDLADLVRAEPPQQQESLMSTTYPSTLPLTTDLHDNLPRLDETRPKQRAEDPGDNTPPLNTSSPNQPSSKDNNFMWEQSDNEENPSPHTISSKLSRPAGGDIQLPRSASSSPEFENVNMSPESLNVGRTEPLLAPSEDGEDDDPVPASGLADQDAPLEDDSDDMTAYSDAEDDELMHQLAAEAEEHARFASTFNHRPQRQNAEEYERELKALRNQQKRDRRDADEVTHVMVTECQQLLQLFGLPYMTAPMEAEAQCAELVRLGLVDGIVTDDSDIFLFGGTRVYKNVFNQAKYVECYLAPDLERDLGLSRAQLIAAAHLLGSDYTDGLPGVGPVTALEILSEFPAGLHVFRDWWAGVQSGSRPASADASSPFRKQFRRKNATKLFLPPGFPDARVDAAYLRPEVDGEATPFVWGVPDLDALRAFLMATIGWGQERADEVLVPVIRDMNRRETEGVQANITRYLGGAGGTVAVGAGAFAPRRRAVGKSRRLESALERMADGARRSRAEGRVEGEGGDGEEGRSEDQRVEAGKTKKKRAASSAAVDGAEQSNAASEDEPSAKRSRMKAPGRRKKKAVRED